jgi:CshA-type fibril repeat protein/VCBS repeat-containing protein
MTNPNFTISGAASNGSASIDATTGIWSYTPTADYHGSDSFTVSVTDDDGNVETQVISLTVTSVVDIADDSDTTSEDAPVTTSVLANDSFEGTPVITAVTNGANGTVTTDGTTTTYTPNANFNGTDSYTYTVTSPAGITETATVLITVSGINDPPVAVNDFAVTDQGKSLTVNVLGNDTDPDVTDTLTITSSSIVSGLGSVMIVGNELVYDPGSAYDSLALGETAAVVIQYTIEDGNGGTDTAELTITVSGTNDGPIVNSPVNSDANEDDPGYWVDLLAGAIDQDTSDSLSIAGLTVVSGDDSGISYVVDRLVIDPAAYNYLAVGETAVIEYVYQIEDGRGGSVPQTATITITGSNDVPTVIGESDTTDQDSSVTVDVLANDRDPDTSDILTLTSAAIKSGLGNVAFLGKNIAYDPAGNYDYLAIGETATVVIDYTVEDGNGGSAVGQLTITVTGTNDGPIARDDSAATNEDNAVTVNVLVNDTDADLTDALTITAATMTSGLGSVSIAGNQLQYNPGLAYHHLSVGETATVTIQYTVQDGKGGSDSAVLTIIVTGTNDGPIAKNATYTINENDTIRVDTALHVSDVDTNDTITLVSATQLNGQGTMSIVNGEIVFDPGTDYDHLAVGETATIFVEYTVADKSGATATAQIILNVVGTNDGPVVAGMSVTGDEDTIINGDLAPLASDLDGDTLTFSAVQQPLHGKVIINPDGTFTYTPEENYWGSDSFTFIVNDGHGGTASAVVAINLNSVIDDPRAVNDLMAGRINEPTRVDVLANDIDPENRIDRATVMMVDPATGNLVKELSIRGEGTYRVNSQTGAITFTPIKDFKGQTTPIAYRFSDVDGTLFAPATFQINVTPRFGFDSFNNLSQDRFGDAFLFNVQGHALAQVDGNNRYLSRDIGAQLAPAPIFSGFAQPGTQIIGRLYDQFGNVVGEARASTDLGGNWMLQFQKTNSVPYARIMIEYVAGTIDADYEQILGRSNNQYQAMQSLTEYTAPLSVNKVFEDSAYEAMKDDRGENINPLGLED